jgi:hypothetical protein
MGRSKFAELQQDVYSADIQAGHERLSLYGAAGTGKSHLLAALVCQLVRQRKRVFYIPDCRQIVDGDPFKAIRTALLFTFYDDSRSCDTINAAKSMGDLLDYGRNLPESSLYVIIDQRNVLESGGNTDPQHERKTSMLDFLNSFADTQV